MTEQVVSFTSPPVVEVVAGVTFDVVSAETDAVLGAFWKDRLREQFPHIQRQPPYQPAIEQFSTDFLPSDPPAELSLSPFPAARLWASATDEQELIQLQPGYFACNWRKLETGAEYDRWPNRRQAFQRWYNEFVSYLLESNIPEPDIRQCEVTYINHIAADDGSNHQQLFDRTFGVSFDHPTGYPFELAAIQAQFLVGDAGNPNGRLYAKIMPAFSKKGLPLYVFELTVRGIPKGPRLDDAIDFLDDGRDAINSAFVTMTSDQIHEEWGMQ